MKLFNAQRSVFFPLFVFQLSSDTFAFQLGSSEALLSAETRSLRSFLNS